MYGGIRMEMYHIDFVWRMTLACGCNNVTGHPIIIIFSIVANA